MWIKITLVVTDPYILHPIIYATTLVLFVVSAPDQQILETHKIFYLYHTGTTA